MKSLSGAIVLALVVAVASSAREHTCVTYGVCAVHDDTHAGIPCRAEIQPVTMDKSTVAAACPTLATGDGVEVPVCCNERQIRTFVSDLKQITRLGVSRKSACFRNFQNLICQSICSPEQDDFVAVNASKSVENGKDHVVETVYVLSKKFAEGVYNSCKDTRTIILGMKLMNFMCGKHGSSNCSPERFLEFIGSTPDQGGHSPFKTHYVISDTPVTVNGIKLRPLDRPLQ